MTLRNRKPDLIEPGQGDAVQGAGGSRLDGDFEFAMDGWRITFSKLTFSQLVVIVEAARRALE